MINHPNRSKSAVRPVTSFAQGRKTFDLMMAARAKANATFNCANKVMPCCQTHDTEMGRMEKWETVDDEASKAFSEWLDQGIATEIARPVSLSLTKSEATKVLAVLDDPSVTDADLTAVYYRLADQGVRKS